MVTYQQPSWVLREKRGSSSLEPGQGSIICKTLFLLVKPLWPAQPPAPPGALTGAGARLALAPALLAVSSWRKTTMGTHSVSPPLNHSRKIISTKCTFFRSSTKPALWIPTTMCSLKTCCYAAMKVLLGNGSKKEGTVRSRTSNCQRKEFTVRHSFTRMELFWS